jgi:hypothetical protein
MSRMFDQEVVVRQLDFAPDITPTGAKLLYRAQDAFRYDDPHMSAYEIEDPDTRPLIHAPWTNTHSGISRQLIRRPVRDLTAFGDYSDAIMATNRVRQLTGRPLIGFVDLDTAQDYTDFARVMARNVAAAEADYDGQSGSETTLREISTSLDVIRGAAVSAFAALEGARRDFDDY